MSTVENRKNRVTLGMKENHALVNWLMDPANIQAGDTMGSIANRARHALNNFDINKDHIYTRVVEFGIEIPSGGTPNSGIDEEYLQDIRDLRCLVRLLIAERGSPVIGQAAEAYARLKSRSGV